MIVVLSQSCYPRAIAYLGYGGVLPDALQLLQLLQFILGYPFFQKKILYLYNTSFLECVGGGASLSQHAKIRDDVRCSSRPVLLYYAFVCFGIEKVEAGRHADSLMPVL